MNVYVSWATVEKAEEGASNLVEREIKVATADPIRGATAEELASARRKQKSKVEVYLPEYSEYLEIKQKKVIDELDFINRDILAIQFVIPALEKVVVYQLAKRVPSNNKLLVSLAARSFLLNTFPGEWDNANNSKHVVFIGLAGLKGFMQKFASACAVLGQVLPLSMWRNNSQIIELMDRKDAEDFINACANNVKSKTDCPEYREAVAELEMTGIGASAVQDSLILLTIAFKLGFAG